MLGCILITTTVEICRLEILQKKIIAEAEKEINKLKSEIEQLKK